jgi:uncharacterized membrane protein YhiD involved in acid resistance
VGIICGAGLAKIAVVASIIITVVIFVLDMMPVAKAPMILIVNSKSADGNSEKIVELAKKYSRFVKVKSRNISGGLLDMVMEVKVSEDEKLCSEMSALSGVNSVSLLSHDGEVTF